MRQRDAVRPTLHSHLMQGRVSGFPGPRRKSWRVSVELQPPYDHGESQSSSKILNVRRFALRGRSEPVVDVADGQRQPVRFGQQREQPQ